MKTKSVKNYLQRVVLSILRTQPDGLPISLLVHNSPKVLTRNDLHRIAKQWLPESMHQVRSVYISRYSEQNGQRNKNFPYLYAYIFIFARQVSVVILNIYFQADC